MLILLTYLVSTGFTLKGSCFQGSVEAQENIAAADNIDVKSDLMNKGTCKPT